ncbi:aldehyde dehydrogenase [Streptomyces sp. PT12]|nr:aldehyde dehydrogenase [Streptomyces sp. PT12]
MTVDGVALPATGTLDVIDPATGRVFAQAPDCAAPQLDRAMAAAAAAFPAWRHDEAARRALLRRSADAVDAAAGQLAPLLTAEQGKPLDQARREVASTGRWLRYFAELERAPEPAPEATPGAAVEVLRRPLGVVAAITPWNYPLLLAAWKIAPALRAGNTVVLKPSPYTPLTSLLLGEVLRPVLPPGVLNVVSGGDRLGALMTAHPTPRKISFTGSVATGRQVAATAALDLKRLTLELGGNDPALVLDDADPTAIADALFGAAFVNNGQACMAAKRVYAPSRLAGPLVEALAARARAVRVDAGTVPGAQLGPVSNRPQYERVGGLVDDALRHGAVAAVGGRQIDRPGYFFEPTVLAGAADGTRVVDEEQFGPVLPVVAYRDLDAVVRRVNAAPYGLTASVWSADPGRAAGVAARLEAGQVSVNAHGNGVLPHLPFGGHRASGLGVENGPWGLAAYTDLQVRLRPATG